MTIQMDLESKWNKSEKDKYHMVSLIYGKQKKQKKEKNKRKTKKEKQKKKTKEKQKRAKQKFWSWRIKWNGKKKCKRKHQQKSWSSKRNNLWTKHKSFEILQWEEKNKKRIKKSEESLCELWDIMKQKNNSHNGSPRMRGGRERGRKPI